MSDKPCTVNTESAATMSLACRAAFASRSSFWRPNYVIRYENIPTDAAGNHDLSLTKFLARYSNSAMKHLQPSD